MNDTEIDALAKLIESRKQSLEELAAARAQQASAEGVLDMVLVYLRDGRMADAIECIELHQGQARRSAAR